jgi:hypothetical protein
MRKLAVRALFVGALVACNGGGGKKTVMIAPDAAVDGGGPACNVLMQTGCMSGQKCSWIEDNSASPPLGHIGCAPSGTVARGAACMYGAPGATGYDNCMKGDVCIAGQCKQICDQAGGAPMCGAGFACGVYSGVFGPVGQPAAAGACDPTCNPLDDNKFGSAKTKIGSACGATSGCYGGPDSTLPAKYTCVREVNNSLYHRAACVGGCADAMGNPYLTGCAQGFVPLLYDMTGSMQVDCISYCAPKDCFQGNCGTGTSGNLQGDPATTHLCQLGVTNNSSGVFAAAQLAPSTMNGDQCMFEWLFDLGSAGIPAGTTTQNSVGYCVNHTDYKYDPQGGTNYTHPWDKCDTLPNGFGSSAATPGAGDFGCVSTTTCGSGCGFLEGKAPPAQVVHIDRPHTLYHRAFAQ